MAPSPRSDKVSREIRVGDHFDSCSTRDRARRFYPELLRRLEKAPSWGEVALSFADVKLVSPSFVDETLVTLAQDRPDLAKRLVVRGLTPFAARRLRSILAHRDLSWTLQPKETEGEYRLG